MTTDRSKFTDEQLALLTDEEREGLLDEEADEEEDDGADDAGADGGTTADNGTDADDGSDDDADTDGGDETDQAAIDAAAAAAAEAEAAAKAAAEAAAADVSGADVQTDDKSGAATADDADEKRPAWVDAEDLTAKKTELKQQLADLAKTFDAGDLTAEEYQAQRDAIEEQREDILTREIMVKTERNIAINAWKQEVASFVKDKPQYQPGGLLHKVLDTKVRELQVGAVNPVSPKLLAKAHAEIQEALGLPIDKKETPAPKKDTPTPPVRRPAPPPTLASIPATDITDADAGAEFSHLDQLLERDSVGFERELAKLSPIDRDRYLAR